MKFGRYLIYVLLFLLLLGLLGGLWLIVRRSKTAAKLQSDTTITTENGIDTLEMVEVNEVKHGLLIRGEDVSNPVLLFVHGGPGTPGMLLHRYFETELLDTYTIVHYDQRGVGKSYDERLTTEDFTINQHVEDLLAISAYVRKRLNQDKIFLLGQSWGSLLGITAARRKPNYYHAYIGLGQIIDMHTGERLAASYAISQAIRQGDDERRALIEGLGEAPYEDPQKVVTMKRTLRELGGVDYDPDFRGRELRWRAFNTPEYDIWELMRIQRAASSPSPTIWKEMLNFNVYKKNGAVRQADTLLLPVVIMGGIYDYQTPYSLARTYYKTLHAPKGKRFVKFEKSGHLPNYEEKDTFIKVMKEEVITWMDSLVIAPTDSIASDSLQLNDI